MNLNNFTTEPISKLFFRYLVSIDLRYNGNVYLCVGRHYYYRQRNRNRRDGSIKYCPPRLQSFLWHRSPVRCWRICHDVHLPRARGTFKRKCLFFSFLSVKCSCLHHLYDHLQHFYKRDCPLSRSNRCHTALCDGLSSLYYMESSGLCFFFVSANLYPK